MADTRNYGSIAPAPRGGTKDAILIPEIGGKTISGAEAWVLINLVRTNSSSVIDKESALLIYVTSQEHLHNDGSQCSNYYDLAYAFSIFSMREQPGGAGGNFLDKMLPRECLKSSRSKSKSIVKHELRQLLPRQEEPSLAPAPAPDCQSSELSCVTCSGAILTKNVQHHGIVYRWTTFLVWELPVSEAIPRWTKDQVHPSCSQSTAPVQPPIGPEPITTPVLKPIIAPVVAPDCSGFDAHIRSTLITLLGNKEKTYDWLELPMTMSSSNSVLIWNIVRRVILNNGYPENLENPGIVPDSLSHLDSEPPLPLKVKEQINYLPEKSELSLRSVMKLNTAILPLIEPTEVETQRNASPSDAKSTKELSLGNFPDIQGVSTREIILYPQILMGRRICTSGPTSNPWVSPIHCVPKKGGMTVVVNEENELFPTRLVTRWRIKDFLGQNLKSAWNGPFHHTRVFPYGTVELSQANGPNFKVNGHRDKHYFGGDDCPDVKDSQFCHSFKSFNPQLIWNRYPKSYRLTPKSKNDKVRVNTEESAVKPEPELKNTVGCNLYPSDGPGKPNSMIMKTVKTKWALNQLQQPICVQLTKPEKTLKAQS
ncbi:hypothetical protein Tco_1214675 [Tanacetum coccineum]